MIAHYLPYGYILDENLVEFMIQRWEQVCYIAPLFRICLFQGILSWGMRCFSLQYQRELELSKTRLLLINAGYLCSVGENVDKVRDNTTSFIR